MRVLGKAEQDAAQIERVREIVHIATSMAVIKGGRPMFCGACACGWVSSQFRDAKAEADADAGTHRQEALEAMGQPGE